jgi:hypothetical protein
MQGSAVKAEPCRIMAHWPLNYVVFARGLFCALHLPLLKQQQTKNTILWKRKL